jgi:hypothetical protein
MAATNYTPIQLYYSTTAAAVPVNTNLLSGELAINITDGKLYYKNNAGTVTLLSSAAGASGDVVGPASATDNALARFDLTTGKLIQNSVGILSDAGALSGITDITASGSITLSGGTANGVAYLNGSKVLTTGSALTFDGTKFTVGIGSTFSDAIADFYQDTNATRYVYARNPNAGAAAAVVFNANAGGGGDLRMTAYGSGHSTLANHASLFNHKLNGQLLFGVEGSERMRLTSTGLGIGTTSPQATIVAAGSNATVYKAMILRNGNGTDGSSATIDFETSAGTQGSEAAMAGRIAGVRTGAGTSGALTFSTTNGGVLGERARIDSSGNLLVGTTINAASAKIFSAGPILTDWSGIIALRYNLAGSINSYYKGMTGTAISNGAARGLHIFNYDGDSNPGILFYPNSYAGQTAAASMTLEPGGNLGVGVTAVTTSGSRRVLQLSNSTNGGMLMLNNSATEGNNPRIFGSVSSAYDLGLAAGSSTGFINFYTNGTDRGRFSAAGDLELYVTAAKDGQLRWTGGGGGALQGLIYCNGNPEVIVQTGGSGGVKLTSGATSWVTASDTRFKNIIEPIANAVDKVNTLSAVIYSFKDDETAERRVGLIAQELLAVLPEAVHVPKKEEEMMGVRYTETIPLLVAAIKEQSALITQLTARITALEGA